MKSKFSRLFLCAAGFGAALSPSHSFAADIVWDGGGDGTTLDLSTNWTGDVLPDETIPDSAVFSGIAAGSLNLSYLGADLGTAPGLNLRLDAGQTSAVSIDTGLNVNVLRLNNVTVAAGAGALTLGNGSDLFNLTLGSAGGQVHTWTNNSASVATVASDVRFGMGGAGNHLLLLTGSGNWALNALLTPSNAANLAIQKTGTGELTLAGGGTLAAFGISTLGNTNFAGLLHGGTTRITSGNYVGGGTNSEWVVGGTDLAGVNTQFIMDGGSLSNMAWVAAARGNGTGSVSSDVILNNSAAISSANFSAGFNGGNAGTAPKGTITLNHSATQTVTSSFYLAESPNSNVTYNLNGTSTLSQTSTTGGESRLGISNGAVATLNVNGGTANFERDLILGYAGTGSGKLVLNSGSVKVGVLTERWLIIGRANGASGQIDVNGGTLNLANGTDMRFGTTNTSAGVSVVNLNGGAITGSVVAQNSLLDLKQNTSTSATLSNTFNLNGGTLSIAQIITSNNTGPGTATFNFNGGTLKPLVSTANFIDLGGATQKVYVKDGGAVIDTNGFNVTVVDSLLAGGTGGLTKAGAGVLTLAAAATYTGATAVNAGTLTLGGSLASSGVSVASGAVLTGAVALGGSLASAGQITPATLGTAGTLSVGNGLVLTGGSLNLDLNGGNNATGGGINDLLAVTGGVSASGTVIVSPTFTSTPAVSTVYTFGTYTGSLSGAASLVAGSRSVAVDTTTAGQLNLVYTGGPAGNLKWSSAASQAWDVLNEVNWVNTGTSSPDRFYQADNVSFDDTAGLQTGVVFSTTLLPATVTVDSSGGGNNYSFSGTGGIGGTGSLIKSGGSTLTIGTANLFSGGTTVNGGAVVLGTATALGTGAVTVNGGVVNLNGQTVANNIALAGGTLTGAGTANGTVSGGGLVKDDATLLALTGANTYSGGTTINAGTLGMARANGANTNLGAGAVTVNASGTLRVGYAVTSNQNVSSTANDIILNGGTVYVDDANQHLTGTLSVAAAGGVLGSTYNSGTNAAAERDKGLALDGVVSGGGGLTIQHTRIGTGNVWHTAFVAFSNNANSYSGTITVNQNTTASEGGVYLGVNGSTALAGAAIVINSNILGTNRKFGNSPVVFKSGLGTATLGSVGGAADLVLTGYDQVNHMYGADAIALTVGGNDQSTTYSGVISGGGSLTKTGSGGLTLTNTSTYTGATTVNEGSLVINGNITTSTLTTVAGTGTLAGSGQVGALSVGAGGTLAPGNSPGILNTGNTQLELGSTLSIEIMGDTVGAGYDRLNVTGTVTLAGTLAVTTGYSPAPDSLFFIIANDGGDAVSGTFGGLAEGTTFVAGGTEFQISYLADSVGNTFSGGNDVALRVVPEASAALLLGFGSLGLALRRRRQ